MSKSRSIFFEREYAGEWHSNVALAHNNLGLLLRAQSDVAFALSALPRPKNASECEGEEGGDRARPRQRQRCERAGRRKAQAAEHEIDDLRYHFTYLMTDC